MARNTSIVTRRGAARPAAMATPMNGAVQGVATTHRQQAGEEAAELHRPRGAGLASVRTRPLPTCEHAGQIQPDGEQQPRHGGDEHRRLELEAPAGGGAGRAGRQQRRAERGEGDQHAGGIGDRLPTRLAPRDAPARPTTFSASTGNTQGIRFRIRPPSNASTSDPLEAHCGRRRRDRAGLGVHRDVGLQPASVAHRQDAGQAACSRGMPCPGAGRG